MSRRPFTVTPALRQRVRMLAAVGTPQDDIARIVGCSAKTLRKHFRRELNTATAEANAVVGGALFEMARNGNVAAQIFWMKTRGGWKVPPYERRSDSEPDPDDPPPPPDKVFLIPDNGRDPERAAEVFRQQEEWLKAMRTWNACKRKRWEARYLKKINSKKK